MPQFYFGFLVCFKALVLFFSLLYLVHSVVVESFSSAHFLHEKVYECQLWHVGFNAWSCISVLGSKVLFIKFRNDLIMNTSLEVMPWIRFLLLRILCTKSFFHFMSFITSQFVSLITIFFCVLLELHIFQFCSNSLLNWFELMLSIQFDCKLFTKNNSCTSDSWIVEFLNSYIIVMKSSENNHFEKNKTQTF